MDIGKQFRRRRIGVQLPVGLKELMSDMSREVLRRQPVNIYIFLADYLESLVKLRNITYRAEQTLTDIIKMSKNIHNKIISFGFEVDDEYQAIHLIRTHLERFCLELMGDPPADNLQNAVDDLLKEMIWLFDDYQLDQDALRDILESSLQAFLKGMRERNQKNIAAIRSGKNWEYCKTDKRKIYYDNYYEESENRFLKDFSECMEKYVK